MDSRERKEKRKSSTPTYQKRSNYQGKNNYQNKKPVQNKSVNSKYSNNAANNIKTKLRVKPSLVSVAIALITFVVIVLLGYIFNEFTTSILIGVLFLFMFFIGRMLDRPKTKSRKKVKVLVNCSKTSHYR